MELPSFDYEFHSELARPMDELRGHALDQLLELKGDHDDMVGALVVLEELTGQRTPHRYQARVVVYVRPNSISVTEKADTPEGAMKAALSGAERKVREARSRLREQWKRP
jgi:hypothetical protein